MGNLDSITCTRRIEWDALHRIPGHNGPCEALHGHRYAAEVTFAGDLDELGRVLDFGRIKDALGGWIAATWDHTGILQRGDNEPACLAIAEFNRRKNRPVYLLEGQPTAENIAKELAEVIIPRVLPNFHLASLRLWETPNCSATWVAE